MKKIILIVFSTFFLSCGITKSPVVPESNLTFSPELNKTCKSEVGISLVSNEFSKQYNAIRSLNDITIKQGYIVKTIEKGTVFINDGKSKKYNFYTNTLDNRNGIAIPVSDGKPMPFEDRIGIKLLKTKDNIEYITTSFTVKEKDYFKQEFIYNGRVGNAIKFTYREFINDLIRPAFSQDLQYDLTESNIVGFRGLRIEVINSNNTEIEYKVLNFFENNLGYTEKE